MFADENGRIDFSNMTINFTLFESDRRAELAGSEIVMSDDINEATEQFILLIELDGDQVSLDALYEGIIIISILDNNRTFI